MNTWCWNIICFNLYLGDKMSHTAAAFFLQKSNEVLTMLKAFKRKTNNNESTAIVTPNDASNSSLSQSKRTSAVNCMDLIVNSEHMSFSDNNDASNIYTEIDLRDVLCTKQFKTKSNRSSCSNDSESFDILHFLFNDISSDALVTGNHNRSETNQSNSYVNETATTQAITEMEMNVVNDVVTNQNLYEINSDVQTIDGKSTRHHQPEKIGRLVESTIVSDASIKSTAFFVNIGKSLRIKLKPTMTDEISESNNSLANESAGASGNDLAKDDIEKASFKKRFKFKFKTGLQFFKDAKV